MVQFNKEASRTRDSCVAKSATLRTARPDSLGKLGTGSSLRKERLFRMTIKAALLRFGDGDALFARAGDISHDAEIAVELNAGAEWSGGFIAAASEAAEQAG